MKTQPIEEWEAMALAILYVAEGNSKDIVQPIESVIAEKVESWET